MNFALVVSAVLIVGCGTTKLLKGGKASTVAKPGGTIEQTVVQSDNPAQVSKQDQETVKTKTYAVPAGSRIEETRVVQMEPEAPPVTNVQAVVVSAPMPVVEREEIRAKSELGAAQKDTAREIGAKLSSLKGIVWVGVVIGVKTFAYVEIKRFAEDSVWLAKASDALVKYWRRRNAQQATAVSAG